ncbi:hypothetical protein BDV25DRAFT_28154 [Aspergillus avenaceus]|uniref:Uncharacterized protein n=1 Tax=Aspergillus avenaceus TaxID=36643 RepID=A0A5N6U5H2_ASPAV|nr:hypothetical protein BDV25DRAFT_28154 [Aspergillus avenaceus]
MNEKLGSFLTFFSLVFVFFSFLLFWYFCFLLVSFISTTLDCVYTIAGRSIYTGAAFWCFVMNCI